MAKGKRLQIFNQSTFKLYYSWSCVDTEVLDVCIKAFKKIGMNYKST